MSHATSGSTRCVFRQRRMWPITASIMLLVIATFASQHLLAQQPGVGGDRDNKSAGELTFRRVFAPADRIDEWPRGAQPYVPVDGEEFERLVEIAEMTRIGVRGALAPRILTAHYEAHLVDDKLVVGTGTLRIDHPRDEPALLILNPCQVAISEATWEDDNLSARMGLDARGRWVVVVPRSGTLRFHWSRRLSSVGPSVFKLPLQLPRGTLASITLELPTTFDVTGEAASVEARDSDSDSDSKTWQGTFAAAGEPALVLRKQANEENPKRRASVSQFLAYQVTPEGLALNCELSVEIGNQSLTQLELELDAPLQLVSAAIDERSLRWSTLQDDGRVRRLLLEFDEPIVESTRLQLLALAPLVRERLAQFPRVRVRDVAWRQGTIRVAALSSLVIDDIETHGCRQVKSEADTEGQRFEFQMFSPDGHVDALVRQRDQRVQVASASTLALGIDEVLGAMSAEFIATEGRRFDLTADVGGAWQLVSLASDPPGAIEGWRVEQPGNDQRRLQIRLLHGLSVQQPLRIVIQARRAAPRLGDPIGLAELEILHFDDTDRGDQLLELRSDDSCHLTLISTDGTPTIEFTDLDTDQRRLFIEPATSPVFVIGRDSDLVVALGRRQPRFAVDIETRLVVESDRTIEQTVIRCMPNDRPVQRLLVRFSHQTKTQRRWSLANADGQVLETIAPSPLELERFGSAGDGETVVILLPTPRSEPFELWAVRSLGKNDAMDLGLVAVPDAAEQTGHIVIEAAPSVSISISETRLDAEVPGQPGNGRFTKTRASYRFDPRADFDLARPIVLSVSRTEENVPRSDLVVWSARVDSSVEASGRGIHLARYWLENAGRRALQIRVPDDCRVNGVWVDGVAVSRRVTKDELSVPLPSSVRYVEVLVQLQSEEPRLGLHAVRLACWPEPNAPVLARLSSIHVPADYEVFATSGASFSSNSASKSWIERLFGPFGRSVDEAPFGPAELDGWLARVSASTTVQTNRAVDALLARFGVAIESTMVSAEIASVDEAGGAATWGSLLDAWEAVAQSEQTPLFIDVHALATVGIDAQTPLIDVARAVPQYQTLALLRRSGLVMVLHGRTIVLTTASANAAIANQLEEVFGATIVRDRGTAWEQPIRWANDGSTARFATVASWRTRSRWPWPVSFAGSGIDNEFRRADTISSADPTVAIQYRLIDKTRLHFAGGAMFLAVLCAALWRGRGHLPLCLVATVVIVATAMFVPSWLVPVSSSAVLGAIAFWAVTMLSPSSNHIPEPNTVKVNHPAVAVARALVFVTAVSIYGYGTSLSAQDNLIEEARPKATPWVFIPVDEDRQPTGDRYHVPIDFDRRLRKFVSEATEKPQGWMLGRVKYLASFSWDDSGTQLQIDSLAATYDFEVFDTLGAIELPLPAGVGGSNTLSVRRNGNSIELPYNSQAQTFTVPVSRRGLHHVEVSLDVMVEHGAMASGFAIPIPPVPTSNVVLELPPDAPPVEIDSALGQVRRAADESTVEADLGGSNSLTVSWPTVVMRGDMQQAGEVDDLVWLRVEPTVVVVQARFHLHVTSGSIDHLDIEVDPQLRLLPLGDANTIVSQAEFVEDDERLLRFLFDPPVTDETTISAQFLLKDASAIGRLNLPRLAATGPRRRQRLLAVSIDPALRADRAEGEGFDEVPTADFLALWGQSPDVPNTSYRLTSSEPVWSLPIRIAAPRVSATETLTVEFQRNRVEVELLVDLESEVGSTFQLGVRAPEALEVELLSTAVEPLVRRWTRLPSGDIAVFLDGPMTGPQQLRLRGTIATPAEGEFVIPDIGMIGCETTDRRIEVYRRPSVLVTPLVADAFSSETPDKRQTATSVRRLIAVSDGEAVPRDLSVRLAVNQPIVDLTLVTSLNRKADSWQAEIDCLLDVQQGVVDLLELRIPPQWQEPLEIEPPLPYRIVAPRGERPATLVIRPTAAVDGQLRLKITKSLEISSGQRVSAPAISPFDTQHARSFIRLPDLAAMQRLEWETQGLLPSVLPDAMLEVEDPEGSHTATVYEVVGNDFQAVLRSASKSDRVPRVWLADVHVVLHTRDTCYGVATLDLDPAGTDRCPLDIPQGYELIRVRVDEQPATLRRSQQGHWEVMLGASDLPHRIEVVYRRQPHTASSLWSAVELAAPSLGTIAVERTLWTVHSAPGASIGHAEPPVNVDQAIEFDLLRLGSMEASLLAAADAQVDHPADELVRWAKPWLQRWYAARRQLERKIVQSPSTRDDPALQAEVKLVDAEHARAVAELGLGDLYERLLEAQSHDSIPTELLEVSTMPDYTVRQIAANGALQILELTATGTSRGIWSKLAVVLVTTIGAWWLSRSERRLRLIRFARRWSLAVSVALGVIWWLFLSPSWFGWLIVLAALWYAIDSPQRRRASSASLSNRAAAYSR